MPAPRLMVRIEHEFNRVLLAADQWFANHAADNIGTFEDAGLGIQLTRGAPWLEGKLLEVYDGGYRRSWESTTRTVIKALRRAGKKLWAVAKLSAESDATGTLVRHEARLGLEVPTEAIESYAAARIPPLVRVSTDAQKRIASRVVSRVAEAGGTLREMQDELRMNYTTFSQARRQNIARTEASHLYNQGSVDRYRASPAVQGMRFMAIVDDRTTEICVWHDGNEYKLDDSGLPVPPLHFMCRSTVSPILFNESPTFQEAGPPDAAKPLPGFGKHTSAVPNARSSDLFDALREGVSPEAAAMIRRVAEEGQGVPAAVPDEPIVAPRAAPAEKLPYDEWAAGLTDDELQAINHWSEDGYEELRVVSRKGTDGEAAIRQHDLLKNALDRAEPTEDILFRGIGGLDDEMIAAFKESEVITLDSLQSASADRDIALEFMAGRAEKAKVGNNVLLHIQNQESAVDISQLSIYSVERESVLRAGTKFEIWKTAEKVDDYGFKYIEVWMDEVI